MWRFCSPRLSPDAHSAFLAVPSAVEFLNAWAPPPAPSAESALSASSSAPPADGAPLAVGHNRSSLLGAMAMLRAAWGTERLQPDSTVAPTPNGRGTSCDALLLFYFCAATPAVALAQVTSMGMVRLPRDLPVSDVPGVRQ